MGFIPGDRGIEREPAALLVGRDVSVVGDQARDVGGQAAGERPPDRVGVSGDCSAVRLARLEHGDRASDAPSFEIEQAVDALAERIGEESAGPDEAELFTFVEKQDHPPLERSILQDRADLEHGRDPDPVVGRSRTHRHAIVMGAEQQRLSVGRSDRRNHVSYASAGDEPCLLEVIARNLIADDRLESHLPKRRDEARPNQVIGGRIRRMWSLIAQNECEPLFGAFGIELARGVAR